MLDQHVELEPFEGVRFAPAAVHLTMQSSGNMLEIAGSIDASFYGECNRCLADVDRTLHVDVEEQLDTGPDAQSDPFGTSNVLAGDRLDVRDLATQLLFGAVPLNVLCAADCKGLCASCGENRNTVACTCVMESD